MYQSRLQENYVLWRYRIDFDLNINTKIFLFLFLFFLRKNFRVEEAIQI